MKKNIAIALLAGLLIGSHLPRANAEDPGITKYDLYSAAALIGILANEKTNVRFTESGFWGASNTQVARQYAQKMLENK